MLSQTSRFHGHLSCLTSVVSRIMSNSTMNGRWTIPRYFDIVAGPGDYFSKWIRVYTPGQWQPVVDSTMGPPPELRHTYQEWQKFSPACIPSWSAYSRYGVCVATQSSSLDMFPQLLKAILQSSAVFQASPLRISPVHRQALANSLLIECNKHLGFTTSTHYR